MRHVYFDHSFHWIVVAPIILPVKPVLKLSTFFRHFLVIQSLLFSVNDGSNTHNSTWIRSGVLATWGPLSRGLYNFSRPVSLHFWSSWFCISTFFPGNTLWVYMNNRFCWKIVFNDLSPLMNIGIICINLASLTKLLVPLISPENEHKILFPWNL
jgi:hypothetical protein